jgi:hypothetical protein
MVGAATGLLNRGYCRPLQSVEIFDEHDVQLSFDDDPDELRQKLIEQGVPASVLPPPPESALTIDADAVRAEAERDNQDLRRQRTPGRT